MVFFMRNWIYKSLSLFVKQDIKDKEHNTVQVVEIVEIMENKMYLMVRDKSHFIKGFVLVPTQELCKGLFLNIQDYHFDFFKNEYMIFITHFVRLGSVCGIPIGITNVNEKFSQELRHELYDNNFDIYPYLVKGDSLNYLQVKNTPEELSIKQESMVQEMEVPDSTCIFSDSIVLSISLEMYNNDKNKICDTKQYPYILNEYLHPSQISPAINDTYNKVNWERPLDSPVLDSIVATDIIIRDTDSTQDSPRSGDFQDVRTNYSFTHSDETVYSSIPSDIFSLQQSQDCKNYEPVFTKAQSSVKANETKVVQKNDLTRILLYKSYYNSLVVSSLLLNKTYAEWWILYLLCHPDFVNSNTAFLQCLVDKNKKKIHCIKNTNTDKSGQSAYEKATNKDFVFTRLYEPNKAWISTVYMLKFINKFVDEQNIEQLHFRNEIVDKYLDNRAVNKHCHMTKAISRPRSVRKTPVKVYSTLLHVSNKKFCDHVRVKKRMLNTKHFSSTNKKYQVNAKVNFRLKKVKYRIQRGTFDLLSIKYDKYIKSLEELFITKGNYKFTNKSKIKCFDVLDCPQLKAALFFENENKFLEEEDDIMFDYKYVEG